MNLTKDLSDKDQKCNDLYCYQCGKEFDENKHIHHHSAKGRHWFILTIWGKKYLICYKCVNHIDLTIYSNSEPQCKEVKLLPIVNSISKEIAIKDLKGIAKGMRYKVKARRSFIEYNKLDFNKKHEANAVKLFQKFGDFFDILDQFKANFNKYYLDDGKNFTSVPFSAISDKIIELDQEYRKSYEELFTRINKGYKIVKSLKMQ